ncbi:MAG TPA: hypothetical protein VFQ92_05645, partial [Blastocatellia bacterium]|nr:hypothetical protein [Blastocatellia bacterium]
AAKSDRLSKYNAVITESLVPLLNAFIVTFLGWVFANVAAGAAERFTELRRSRIESVVTAERKPLEPIRLL